MSEALIRRSLAVGSRRSGSTEPLCRIAPCECANLAAGGPICPILAAQLALAWGLLSCLQNSDTWLGRDASSSALELCPRRAHYPRNGRGVAAAGGIPAAIAERVLAAPSALLVTPEAVAPAPLPVRARKKQPERECQIGDEAESVGRLSRSRWTLGFTR